MAEFTTTEWSVVFAAAGGESEAARNALASLYVAYHRPLYGFLRRSGYDSERARDLTAQFFSSHIVTGVALRGLVPGEGRFRSWLLTCLKNMARNEHQHARRHNPETAFAGTSLELHEAEQLYALQAPLLSPERLYDRSWAEVVLERAHARLAEQVRATGKLPHHSALLAPALRATEPPDYPSLARELGMAEPALRKAVQRLRQAYGEAIRSEVRATVSRPSDVEEELRYLLSLYTEADE